jgi:Domain of unknown function (DUF4375)
MTEIIGNDWLVWLLNIGIIFVMIGFVWKLLSKNLRFVTYFDINEGNQHELNYFVTIKKKQLDDIVDSYKWDEYDEYENRATEYMELLFDNLTEKHQGKVRSHKFWKELTRGQKIFWSYLAFEGEVDNGGLFQFLHNKPEHLHSARQVMVELNQTKLLKDYDIFLDEIQRKNRKLSWNSWLSNNPFASTKNRIQSFSDGYKILESPKLISSYFYSDEFKKQWDKSMCDYIESNYGQFAVIE